VASIKDGLHEAQTLLTLRPPPRHQLCVGRAGFLCQALAEDLGETVNGARHGFAKPKFTFEKCAQAIYFIGDPDRIRTCGLLIRSQSWLQ